MLFKLLKRISTIVLIGLIACGCSADFTSARKSAQNKKNFETFGYRSWRAKMVKKDIVVIGIHGFCGASVDYNNLGQFFLKNQPHTALYAYEVRGQGRDPKYERRGDIGNPEQWYADLQAFTKLVKKRHPDAKIIWYGESMGSLIATHAITKAPHGAPPCDALVLSSPIVRFKDDIEPWKIALVRAAATTLPLARLPLDAIAGQQEVQMTQETNHSEQSQTNDYNVEKHTLRLLGTLTDLIDGMNDCASQIEVPTLVLHGGKDYFNNDADIRGFTARIPSEIPLTYKNYPNAYHLLMYDEKREEIFADVTKWLNLRRRD